MFINTNIYTNTTNTNNNNSKNNNNNNNITDPVKKIIV